MRLSLVALCGLLAASSLGASATAAMATPSPELKLVPMGVQFGAVPVGGSATKPVTILNRTKTTLAYAGAGWPNLQHPELAYPYGIWNDSFDPFPCWEIAPNSSCSLNFKFTPAAPGPFASTFVMTYTDGTNNFSSNTIDMAGTGK